MFLHNIGIYKPFCLRICSLLVLLPFPTVNECPKSSISHEVSIKQGRPCHWVGTFHGSMFKGEVDIYRAVKIKVNEGSAGSSRKFRCQLKSVRLVPRQHKRFNHASFQHNILYLICPGYCFTRR